MLRNELGYQCCLGFVCEQSGVDPKSFELISYPKHLAKLRPDEGTKISFLVVKLAINSGMFFNSYFADRAANINDRLGMAKESDRESALISLFNEHGFDLEFIN